jgi:(R,R)-butanediol dehydrogenase/meso-butanediol dehydrogenase/diacetyl reductase
LVAGGGPIGQLICLAARAAGAAAINLSEPSEGRRARAAVLDGVELLDPTQVDVAEYLGKGVDVAFECAGNQPSLAGCMASVCPGGTLVQTALHIDPVSINPRRLTLNDITMRGVNCFPVTSWPRVISLISSGAMPVEQLISSTVPLSDAVEGAFDVLTQPGCDEVKVLLDPSR